MYNCDKEELENRILCESVRERVMSPEEAAGLIRTGMTVAVSGFGTGFPRLTATALEQSHHATELTVISAALRGERLISAWSRAGIIKKFVAFQWSEDARNNINAGNIEFVDCHLGQLNHKVKNGYFGHIDYAILEIVKINEDGSFVPGIAGGIVDTMTELADKVILEINLALPTCLEGVHDLHIPEGTIFPNMSEKHGVPFCKCPPEKIAGVVFCYEREKELIYPTVKDEHTRMAQFVVELLRKEIAAGTIPENFNFQCGTGVVINCVLIELMKAGFKNLNMYTEVLGEQALMAMLDGTILNASTTAMDMTDEGFHKMYEKMDYIREHLALRNLAFTNGPAQIMSYDLVSMNGALEVDIYGNVNSSHAFGTHMVNGIGGANDFCRNANISVFSTMSISRKGAISRVVPMVSHVDNTEHDVDVIVTEWGYADLRGKSPKERVPLIIENCAHPDYREQLWKYYNGAVEKCGYCHTPHDLTKALNWHERYLATGTMLE